MHSTLIKFLTIEGKTVHVPVDAIIAFGDSREGFGVTVVGVLTFRTTPEQLEAVIGIYTKLIHTPLPFLGVEDVSIIKQ